MGFLKISDLKNVSECESPYLIIDDTKNTYRIRKRDLLKGININVYSTLLELKTDVELKPGELCLTNGFYSANDNGGANYIISDDETLVANGYNIQLLDNGLKAILIIDDVINVKQLGAKGDGESDDLEFFLAAINLMSNGKTFFIPNGMYKHGSSSSSSIIFKFSNLSNIKVVGDAKERPIIIAAPDAPVNHINMGGFIFYNCKNVVIENIEYDGNLQNRHAAYNNGLWSDDVVNNKYCSALELNACQNILVKNCYLHHPVIDCILLEQQAGVGRVSNVVIDTCVLDYGYRQGISIVACDDLVIKNSTISNTANAISLLDSTTPLGTEPRAGIDSETWDYNNRCLISNCFFTNNRGGHINFNDGACFHNVENCVFDSGQIVCQTPSNGLRTLHNSIRNSKFNNCSLSLYNGQFIIDSNNFNYSYNASLSTALYNSYIYANSSSYSLAGKTIYSNNSVVVDAESFANVSMKVGTITTSGEGIEFINNKFIDIRGAAANTILINSLEDNLTLIDNKFIATDAGSIGTIYNYHLNSHGNEISSNYVNKNMYQVKIGTDSKLTLSLSKNQYFYNSIDGQTIVLPTTNGSYHEINFYVKSNSDNPVINLPEGTVVTRIISIGVNIPFRLKFTYYLDKWYCIYENI